jgi:hypothetical protein
LQTLLRFFARSKNPSLFISCNYELFNKKPGGMMPPVRDD